MNSDNDSSSSSSSSLSSRYLSFEYETNAFKDIVGHEVIIKALSNIIHTKKLSPLYLFHGPCGTGKTSVARIFAESLNSEYSISLSPCFEHIQTYISDTNKCTDMPCSSFKVFIIEGALYSFESWQWHELMKLVETFDDKMCILILICEDLGMIPKAVSSRCQKFRFARLKDDDVMLKLSRTAEKDRIRITGNALKLIAENAKGNLREAENLLQQLELLDSEIDIDIIQQLVGLVSQKKLIHLIEAAFSGNFTEAVTCTRDIISSGIEPNALMSQLSSFVVELLSDTSFSASNTKKRMEWLCKTLQILTETEKELMKIEHNHIATVIAAILQIESASPSEKIAEGICHLLNKSDMVDTERKAIAQQLSNGCSTNEKSNSTENSKINGEALSKGQKYESIDSIAKAAELKLRLLSLTSFPLIDASIETYSQDLLFEEANLSRRLLDKDFLGPGQHMHEKHYMNGELKRSQSCTANIGRRENVNEDSMRLSAKSHLMKWARPCRNSAVMNSISKLQRSDQKKPIPTSSSSSSKTSPSGAQSITMK